MRVAPPQEGVRASDLEALADRVAYLRPHHRDPERFHVEKDEIAHELLELAAMARRVAR